MLPADAVAATSRTTRHPALRATSSIAAPMSRDERRRAPRRATSRQRARHRRLARLGARSPTKKSQTCRRGTVEDVVTSTLRMSPGARLRRARGSRGRRRRFGSYRRRRGSPCSRAGWAPPPRAVSSRTSRSIPSVDMPGRSWAPTKAERFGGDPAGSSHTLDLPGAQDSDGHRCFRAAKGQTGPIPFWSRRPSAP